MGGSTLGIFGAGGLGREVLELAKIINESEKRWERFIFVVDEVTSTEVNGVSVFSYADIKEKYANKSNEAYSFEMTIGIGEPAVREAKLNQLQSDGIKLATLIHPSVHIPETTTIGHGTVIQQGCFVSCNVRIGDNVYLQPQCIIGHDDVLEDGCMIAGCGNLGGNVHLGKNAYVGMSAAIKEGLKVGAYAIVGMGAVVHKDVPVEITVVGNPAREVAKNTERRVFK